MPIQSKAGTKYPRLFDPKGRRVAPNGTQPLSAYTAPLVYNATFGQDEAYYPLLTAPPDSLFFQLLLFGSDYPVIVRGTQIYGTDTYNANGDRNAVSSLTFSSTLADYGFTTASIPQILPNTGGVPTNFLPYQKIAKGPTLTHGVETAGFPVGMFCLGHDLWETASGDAADRASFLFGLEVLLQSGSSLGPANYFDPNEVYEPYLPVILYEPDFTQAVVDNGYKIAANLVTPFVGGLPATLDVVGLWNVDGYVPPLAVPQGGLRQAAPFAAPLDDAPAVSLREAALAATANFRRQK